MARSAPWWTFSETIVANADLTLSDRDGPSVECHREHSFTPEANEKPAVTE